MDTYMGKITGLEKIQDVPEKVRLLYDAVSDLISAGADINQLRVSAITEKAGIGKGTAYDYFDTKEELIACALTFYIGSISQEIKSFLLQQSSFEKQIALIMDEIEKEGQRQQWFLRFVHVMTDVNEVSCLVRRKIEQDEMGRYLPVNIFAEVIKQGKDRGEIRRDVPDDYLICSIFARLFTYMITIYTKDCFKVKAESIRPLIFKEIMNEFSGLNEKVSVDKS